jgi:hypothetical protein
VLRATAPGAERVPGPGVWNQGETVLRLFRFPFSVTLAGIAGAVIVGGPAVAGVVAVLAILEVSLSFDNAVVNATVLQRMDERWQRVFLTVGILIAVFGMRLLFPLVVVAISAHLSPTTVFDLAVNHPVEYAHYLHTAHPAIAAFGGIFLAMIFLEFVFETHSVTWLGLIERPLAKVGKLDQSSVIVALVLLVVAATTFAYQDAFQVLIAGTAGLATYVAVSSLAALFERDGEVEGGVGESGQAPGASTGQSGSAGPATGLFTFLYLEILDASFSFDGVVGAFAITDQIFVIALGLGIGACYIRALTVYLVRKGTLAEYVHLEHGAHWAIGALAVMMFITIRCDVPRLVTGLIGITLIGAALATSIVRNRHNHGRTGGGDAEARSVGLPAAV